MEAILKAPASWQGLPQDRASQATNGIREALTDLQRSLKDEFIRQRLRQELKRERRQFRQVRKVEQHWLESIHETEDKIRFLVGAFAKFENIGESKAPRAVQLRNQLTAERGQLTRHRKAYDSARERREAIQTRIDVLRTQGLHGIRLLIHELNPHAVILIQPESYT
jgi:hypothetical protein